MNSINITLQENEANALLQLIDVAIKAQGLQVAEAGAVLAQKVTQQAQAQIQTEQSELAPVADEKEES